MSHEELLRAATVIAASVDDIDRGEIADRIDRLGVVVVRGLNTPDEVIRAKQQLAARFSVENDRPSRGETSEELYANLQKFAVYGSGFRPNAHPQCLRSFYNPIWAEDIYGMREIFRRTARLRNLLSEVALDWAVDEIEDGFWTAARLHHYPAGGGFMDGHREIQVPKVYEEAGLSIAYFQPLVVMSKRGTGQDCDFETGGGFFEDNGQPVYYESYCEPGDVLVYDTRVIHGVSEIDSHKPFRQDSLEGRFAAFVTLFKDLSVREPSAR